MSTKPPVAHGAAELWPDRFHDSRKTPMVGRKEIRCDQIRRQLPIDWISRSYANLAGLSGWCCRALAVCVMRQPPGMKVCSSPSQTLARTADQPVSGPYSSMA